MADSVEKKYMSLKSQNLKICVGDDAGTPRIMEIRKIYKKNGGKYKRKRSKVRNLWLRANMYQHDLVMCKPINLRKKFLGYYRGHFEVLETFKLSC